MFDLRVFWVALCVSALFAPHSFGQETQDTADTAPVETSTGNGAQVLSERFEDWVHRCVVPEKTTGAEVQPVCELFQSVQIEQDGVFSEILNVSVSKANDKAGKVDWAVLVLAPADVHLPSDFGLSMGSRPPILTRYRNCNQLGCWVVIPADRAVLSGLKKATEGAGHFRLLNGQVVKIVFSLKGFTRAFNALASGQLPAPETKAKPEAAAQ